MVTGTGGSSATGTGGNGNPGEASGGCACDTAAGAPSLATTVLGLLFGMVIFARQRSRRAPMD